MKTNFPCLHRILLSSGLFYHTNLSYFTKSRQISSLQPLEKELKKKKIELSELESEVKNKKSELGNFNTELKKIKKDIGTASNKVGGSKTDVGFEPSPILLVALIISLSLNLFAISQLGNIGLLQRR